MRDITQVTGYLPHPVKGVSIVFAVLYLFSGVLHAWQNYKYKSWPLVWFTPFACIIFVGGFICREVQAWNPQDDLISATQGLLWSAVVVLTSALYAVLPSLLPSRLNLIPIRLTHLSYMIIALTFSALITLSSQGCSQFFSATATPGQVSSALAILEASLILQLFLNITSFTTVHIFRSLSRRLFHQPSPEHDIKIRLSVYSFFTLAVTRNLFRTIQIFLPSNSPAWTVEAYFWVFDATPMLLFSFLLNIMHPAKYADMPGNCRSHLREQDSPAVAKDQDVETGVERKTIELQTVHQTTE